MGGGYLREFESRRPDQWYIRTVSLRQCDACQGLIPEGRTTTCSRSCQLKLWRVAGSKAAAAHKAAQAAERRAARAHPCESCGRTTINDRYCSRSCAATVNNARQPKRKSATPRVVPRGVCRVCGKSTHSLSRQYCSSECLSMSKRPQWYSDWLDGQFNPTRPSGAHPAQRLRQDLLRIRGAKCEQCGWDKLNPVTKQSPIEMDHIDGDRSNNFISNLRLLCPNCHSLTPTYRYLNTPASRRKRGL